MTASDGGSVDGADGAVGPGASGGRRVGRVFSGERGQRFDAAIRRWIEAGSPVAEPRVAATVMLLRDGEQGIEVFVQERAATMAFAPAMVVFPGGRVDPVDASASVSGEVLSSLAGAMRVPSDAVRAIVGAALREVEEECGVRLDAAALRPRARWLTPAFEPRRYDTWFFAAALPTGQVAKGTTRETVDELWGRPDDLLAQGRAGELALMPPTIVALEGLSAFASVAEALADTPALTLVEPKVIETDTGYALESHLP